MRQLYRLYPAPEGHILAPEDKDYVLVLEDFILVTEGYILVPKGYILIPEYYILVTEGHILVSNSTGSAKTLPEAQRTQGIDSLT